MIKKLDELNLSNCSMMSNSWVMLNYLGETSLPLSRPEFINESIRQGKLIVLFKHVEEPEHLVNAPVMESLPVIYENRWYVIFGEGKCLPKTTYDKTFLEEVDDTYSRAYSKHINTNPCFILFHKVSLLEKTCNFANLKGFKQDEYRVLNV